MRYKDYIGSVHYSDDEIFYRKVESIKALISYESSYESSDVESLKRNFHEAADDYPELCTSENIEC